MPARKTTTAAAAATETTDTATKAVEATLNTARETVEEAVKTTQEAAVRKFDEVVEMGKGQMEQAGNRMFKGYEELAEMQKANMDAVVASASELMKGSEEMGKAIFTIGRSNLDHSLSATKSLMTAKSVREFVDLQSDYVKQSIDTMMSDASRLSDMAMKLASSSVEPIQNRVNVVVERATKVA